MPRSTPKQLRSRLTAALRQAGVRGRQPEQSQPLGPPPCRPCVSERSAAGSVITGCQCTLRRQQRGARGHPPPLAAALPTLAAALRCRVAAAAGNGATNVPEPVVKIDNEADPFATVVTISFGDRLGELLDTVGAQLRQSTDGSSC